MDVLLYEMSLLSCYFQNSLFVFDLILWLQGAWVLISLGSSYWDIYFFFNFFFNLDDHFLPRFRKFSTIISLNMLSALLLSYSSSGISIMNILIYFMVSHKVLKLFTQFFTLFFFLFLLWLDNFKWLVFSSPWSVLLSSAWSSLLLKPYSEFFSYYIL